MAGGGEGAAVETDDFQRSLATYALALTLSYLSVHVLLVACPSAIGGLGIWAWKRDSRLTACVGLMRHSQEDTESAILFLSYHIMIYHPYLDRATKSIVFRDFISQAHGLLQ